MFFCYRLQHYSGNTRKHIGMHGAVQGEALYPPEVKPRVPTCGFTSFLVLRL